MKRKKFVRQLTKDGCVLLRVGARHDIYINPSTGRKQPVPRHIEIDNHLGLVNKLSSIFGWLWLRLAVSAKLGLPTSSPAFCFLASLVLVQPKTKPNFFTSPKQGISENI